VRWLLQQLDPLARNPGGAHRWAVFWLAVVCGIAGALRTNRTVGLMLLAVPVSGFLFSGFGFAPLAERLAFWMLPSLYAAIAVAADEGAAIVRRTLLSRAWFPRAWPAIAFGVFAAGAALLTSADIVQSGVYELSVQPRSKHGLDDRAAMRYLLAARQPGDALVTTRMGLPAVWWYGAINVAGPGTEQAFPDGGPVLDARFRSGDDCRPENLPPGLHGRARVLVYLGFASRDLSGFPELVLDTLSRQGKLVAYRRVAEEGVAAVFDLTQQPGPWMAAAASPGGLPQENVPRPGGCAGFFPARRW
jgi:hypothetical protein